MFDNTWMVFSSVATLLSNKGIACPTDEELYTLMSSQENFELAHIQILRRLAESCKRNPKEMLAKAKNAIYYVAEHELHTIFPPPQLPKNAKYYMHVQYDTYGAAGVAAEVTLQPQIGEKAYILARHDSVRIYCENNLCPAICSIFDEVVRFIEDGLDDQEILSLMNPPHFLFEEDMSERKKEKILER